MKPLSNQFLHELKNPKERTFSIAFIGMSSIGKTKWSKHLGVTYNYPHIEIDTLIGKSDSFVKLIKSAIGSSTVEELGNYFGKPWDKGYSDKEAAYLAIEAQCMSQEFECSIVDLTGSAVYHPSQLKAILKKTLVIYLQDDPGQAEAMIKAYLKHPKPVCWQGIFEKYGTETNDEALTRCYPLLLRSRQRLYEKYADVIVPWHSHANDDIELFVKTVQRQLS